MKKILYILLALLGVCQLAACGGDEKESISLEGKKLAGEWHLVSWNAAQPTEFDAYIAFNSNKTFEIYQKIEKVSYQKFTGKYQVKGATLTGVYTDNSPFVSAYQISFNEAGDTLTMTSDASVGEVSVYKRAPIPASIKSGAVITAISRAIKRLL